MSTIVTSSAATGASGTTYVSGLSGFDSSALIEAAVEAKMAPAYRLDVQIEALEAEAAAYAEMSGLLDDLATAAQALSSDTEESAYASYAAYLTAPALDDPTAYMAVTVTEEAELGVYEVTIDQLAQAMKVAAAEQATGTALALEGSFTLAADGYDGAEIAVDGEMTLSDIAAAINAASADTGVTATLVRTSNSGSTLVLSAADTGVSFTAEAASGDDVLAGLGLTDSEGAFANQVQAAQMAQVTVDGITVTSSTNEIEDLLPGVSLNLYAATAGETITVEVGQDLSAVRDAVEAFVDAFNAYRTFAITQQATGDDGASDAAVLFGETTLKSANAALYDVIETTVTVDGTTYALADIGLTYTAGNMLGIDDDALEGALLQHPEVVEALFASRAHTDSADLGVGKLPAGVASGTYQVDVTYDAGSGEITSASIDGVALEVSGASLVGAEGTAFEGLRLVYTGTADASVELTVSQGLADVMMAMVETYADDSDGLVTAKIESLDASVEAKQDRRDEIAERAAAYEDDLIDYYARLEQAIAAADIALQQLQALLDTDDD
ncbi:MAG: flagellar filament capping protein FliD [Rhodospirillaceae bacterium]|nr:flagellar filament capping protein FliD [Rhodospirillaceae bacterium]